ncbi:MAG TPA: hypothetical protein VFG05_01610 [Methylocella sp.]|jgi:hypothetical protein|nr:hypothetical protein [Methylocella sp.]
MLPYVIHADPGGMIEYYIEERAELEHQGRQIVIDGMCASACTILAMSPNACATDRAVLGFHRASFDPDGAEASPRGTAYLEKAYTPGIRSWLRSRGGLTPIMKWLSGRDLFRFVRRCEDT